MCQPMAKKLDTLASQSPFGEIYLQINHEIFTEKENNGFEMAFIVPILDIIANLWENLNHAVHTRKPKKSSELEDFCKEQ